jgi:hypothetical protein
VTDILIRPGLREGPYVYFGGFRIGMAPQSVDLQFARVEVDDLLADTSTLTERPAEPWTGCPAMVDKAHLSLGWEGVAEADVAKFERVAARSFPVDVGIWRPKVETWSGSGTTAPLVTARRHALKVISSGLWPVAAAAKYQTIVLVNGTALTETTDYTIGSYDSLGRTTITPEAAWTSGTENIEVLYYPVFLMKIMGLDPNYPANNREGRKLVLKEVA